MAGKQAGESIARNACESGIAALVDCRKRWRKADRLLYRARLLAKAAFSHGALRLPRETVAPLVGASLAVMESDTGRMRSPRPFLFANLKENHGGVEIGRFLAEAGGLAQHTLER